MAAGGALTRRQIAAVVAGNGLEFYDFLTYSFFAVQIGEALFPGGGDTKLLLSLATFGVGFATRPLGGFVIGRMADRKGAAPGDAPHLRADGDRADRDRADALLRRDRDRQRPCSR